MFFRLLKLKVTSFLRRPYRRMRRGSWALCPPKANVSNSGKIRAIFGQICCKIQVGFGRDLCCCCCGCCCCWWWCCLGGGGVSLFYSRNILSGLTHRISCTPTPIRVQGIEESTNSDARDRGRSPPPPPPFGQNGQK